MMIGFCLLVLGTGTLLLFQNKLAPAIIAMTETRAKTLALEAITTGVRQTMAQHFNYDELITMQNDPSGKVAYVQANTLLMSDLSAMIATNIQEKLLSLEEQRVYVPLGSALGGPLLANLGPKIPVRFTPMGSAATSFETVFDNAGINQTRHRVFLHVTAYIRIVVPTASDTVSLEMNMPIVETIIVGDVPQTFVHVDETNDALRFVE